MFNQYSVAIMAILFEIIGSFLLVIETFGMEWKENFFRKIIIFSKWSKEKYWRAIWVTMIGSTPTAVGFLMNDKLLKALGLPFVALSIGYVFILDDAKDINDWITNALVNKRISRAGFVLLLTGNFLQFVTILMQIKS